MVDRWITFRTVSFRVSNPVHPVSSPSLAEMGAVDQMIDEVRIAIGLFKSFCPSSEFIRRGWQPDERKKQSSDEDSGRGHLDRFESVFVPLRLQELIDGMLRPDGTGAFGGLDRPDGLKAPPLLSLLENAFPSRCGSELLRRGGIVARIGGTHRDPLFEVGDHAIVEFRAVLRHVHSHHFMAQDR